MAAHVVGNVVLAHPLECALPEILPVGHASDIGGPFLNVRVLAVAELLPAGGDEGSRVDGVEQFLIVERHSGGVDRAEPLLDLTLGATALVDEDL